MAARAACGVRSEGYGPTALLVSLFLAHSGRVSLKAHLRFPSDDLLKPFKVKKKPEFYGTCVFAVKFGLISTPVTRGFLVPVIFLHYFNIFLRFILITALKYILLLI